MEKKSVELEEAGSCPECKGTSFIEDRQHAEVVCRACGCVIEDSQIDGGPDWKATQDGENSTIHVGGPRDITNPDNGMVTWTGDHRLDRAIIQTLNSQPRHRNKVAASKDTKTLCESMGLPRIAVERASHIYRQTLAVNFVQGRSIHIVVAASVYAACKLEGIPRTLGEFSRAARVDRRTLGRTYIALCRRLKVRASPTDPRSYIDQFCSRLKLSMRTVNEANAILKEAVCRELVSGRGPTGLAAAAIYLATQRTGERARQKDIARVAEVSEVTVRNRSQELARRLGLDADGAGKEAIVPRAVYHRRMRET